MRGNDAAAGGRSRGGNGFEDGAPMRGNMLASNIMLG